MRKNLLRQRRGFTVAELTVVLAITAIVTLMIVSFSTLFSAQVKQNTARANFLEDAAAFRTAVQKQFAEMDSSATTFSITVDEDSLNFGTNEFSFKTNEDVIIYQHIDRVDYATNGKLLKITLTNENIGETQSFVLFSRLGATFTDGAEGGA